MVLASCFRCCRAPHVAIQVLLGGVAAVGGVRQTHHAHTSTHSSCLRHAFRHTRALSPRHTHESVHAQRGELRHARGGVGADSEGGVRVHGSRTSCGVLLSISVKLGEPRVRHR